MTAVVIYRKHAEWKYMARLFPYTIGGIILGCLLLDSISDRIVGTMIGGILLAMTAMHFYNRKRALAKQGNNPSGSIAHGTVFIATTGIAGGFATMVANAAGPIASMYLLAVGLPKYAFIGTSAWFFLIINWIKVPLQVHLGNISGETIGLSLLLGIPAIIGALTAPKIVKHIPQKLFEKLIWFFIILAGLRLIWNAL